MIAKFNRLNKSIKKSILGYRKLVKYLLSWGLPDIWQFEIAYVANWKKNILHQQNQNKHWN